MPDAVIFDLDGVLLDSEPRWNAAREALVREMGGRWSDDAPRAMMGMSSPEWAQYLRDALGVPMEPDAISRDVVQRMRAGYAESLPLLPGATDAVTALAERWPVGLASSANREIIDLVLELAGLADAFRVTLSSEEVERGKPAPDVYLEVARRLEVSAERCVAIEDSSNGLRSAAAARMVVIAVPNPHYPPDPDALALAAGSVATVGEVTPALVDRAAASMIDSAVDHVRGSADAPLILEYGDYECPYSRKAYRAIQQVERELDGKVRFAFRHFPLTEIHPHALAASAAAEAAALQGRFWEMHDVLFHHQKALEPDDLRRYAADLTLEPDAFDRDLVSDKVIARVRRDVESGLATGKVLGTPTLFVDGLVHVGGYDAASLIDALGRQHDLPA
jgi:HAD superfamily hydrolase (TIGR01509 family)